MKFALCANGVIASLDFGPIFPKMISIAPIGMILFYDSKYLHGVVAYHSIRDEKGIGIKASGYVSSEVTRLVKEFEGLPRMEPLEVNFDAANVFIGNFGSPSPEFKVCSYGENSIMGNIADFFEKLIAFSLLDQPYVFLIFFRGEPLVAYLNIPNEPPFLHVNIFLPKDIVSVVEPLLPYISVYDPREAILFRGE